MTATTAASRTAPRMLLVLIGALAATLALVLPGVATASTAASLFQQRVPANISPEVASLELGTVFSSSVAGRVTAVRFYKDAANTGTHVGTLWTRAGSVLARVTFTNETASGWQTARLSTPVSIAAGTQYVVSYTGPNGRYAHDLRAFTTAYTSGPLTVPANGGVYRYGAGGVPTGAWEGSNYYADVLFEATTTSTPTNTSTPTPTVPVTSAGAGIPRPFVGGYLEGWHNVLPRQLPASYKLLWFSFATISADGTASLWHAQDKAALIADIKAWRAAGKPVILSIGGSNGVKAPPRRGAIADNYYRSLLSILEEYGFSGIDWDVEHEAIPHTTADMDAIAAGMVDVSTRLKNHYNAKGRQFLITMAPYSTPSVIGTYQRAARGMLPILSMVNYQFYNNSTPPTHAFVRGTLDAWKTAVPGLRNDQWSLGFLHVDDWNPKTTSYSTMRDIWNRLKVERPGVLGVWSWGIGEKEALQGYPFQRELAATVYGSRPSAPGLRTGTVTATTVALHWTPPARTGVAVTGYRFGWVSSTGLPAPSWRSASRTPANPLVVRNLAPRTTYTMWVEAYNAAGTGARTRVTVTTAAG